MPPTQNLVLRYQQTGGIWQSLSIPEGNLLIGRKSDSYLKLSGGDVSRHHAEIRRRGDQVWIVDLGSRNGTWINGKPLPRQVPQPFIPGQSITIGNYTLTLDHPQHARDVAPIPATGGRGGFIFISYSRRNKNLVDPFVRKLQNDGFTIWIDRKDIKIGSRWDEEIVRAIHEADAFLLLLSPDAAASDYVADELRVARGANAHIMPVILQPVAIPASMKLNLAGRQHIDIFRDPAGGYSQLLQGLHARREYLRQHPELAPKPYHQMEMILERESLRSFTQEKQQQLLAFLAQTSRAPVSNFSVAGAYAGSVRVIINMPAEAAYRIKALALNGDPVLVQAGISALRLVGEAQFIPTGGGPPPAAGQPPGQPSGGGSPPAAPAGGLSKMSLLLGGAAIVIVTIGIGLLAGTRPETEPTPPPVTPETQVVPIPSVSFTSADETAAEDDDVLTLTAMLSSVHDQDVTIPYTLSGSAEQMEDYHFSPDPLVIPAGERTADLTIQILDDDQVEATEEIFVNLEQPDNADLGSITEFRVTITDNDAPPIVYFAVEAQSVEEDAGNVIITANLSETYDHDVTVPYFFGGSATQGEDFIFDADSFVIQAGELSTGLTVNIIDDQISEEIKDIVVTLDTPVNASLGILTEHIITIFDDEEPGIIVDPISGLMTDEDGSPDTFEVFLATQPQNVVTIALSSSDDTEGKIDKSTLTFTRDDWDVPQTVTVFGVYDAEEDADISYMIIIEPASSDGPDYNGIDPPDVEVTNIDIPIYECEDVIGCIDIEQGSPIYIGSLLDFGHQASLSDAALLGIEKAIVDAGRNLRQYPIELVGEDASCSFDRGELGATRLVENQDLVGVIGTICAGSAFGALPVLSDAGSLMISPANTSPALTDPTEAWLPGYYRTSPNEKQQAVLAAEYLSSKESGEAAIIYDDYPGTQFLSGVFRDNFKGTIVFDEFLPSGTTDFSSIDSTLDSNPYVDTYLSISPDLAINLLPAMSDSDEFIQGVAPDYLDHDEVKSLLAESDSSSGYQHELKVTRQFLDSDEFNNFISELFPTQSMAIPPTTAYPVTTETVDLLPPMNIQLTAAYAYDATNLLLRAINEVAEIDEIGELHIGKHALRKALGDTRGYPGVTGSLTCGDFGDCGSIEVWDIQPLR